MSYSGWARFVSEMNQGTGVPCTLDHVAGERMPTIPYRREVDGGSWSYVNYTGRALLQNPVIQDLIKNPTKLVDLP